MGLGCDAGKAVGVVRAIDAPKPGQQISLMRSQNADRETTVANNDVVQTRLRIRAEHDLRWVQRDRRKGADDHAVRTITIQRRRDGNSAWPMPKDITKQIGADTVDRCINAGGR